MLRIEFVLDTNSDKELRQNRERKVDLVDVLRWKA